MMNAGRFSVAMFAIGLVVVIGCGRKMPRTVVASATNAEQLRNVLNQGGAGGGGGIALPDPTGFVDVVGSFKLDGAAPSLGSLGVSGGDSAYCTADGPVPNEQLVVNADNKGIRDVLIFVTTKIPEDNPLWEHEELTAKKFDTLEGREFGFDQEKCRFLSHVFAMRSTQTVQILNSDTVGHNTAIAGEPPRVASINPTLPAGATDVYEPGGESSKPFSVSCAVHPWMKAWMITRNNPYFAVSDPDGNFTIPKVPTGVKLELRVWQETKTFLSGAVNLNGASLELKKGRMKTQFEAADNKLDFVIPAAMFN